MVTRHNDIGNLARQFGLARAPLFRDHREGEHEVLLDGAFGSFAVSRAADIDPMEASSWAWSSNIPHHVSLSDNRVRILRWDRPDDTYEFDAKYVFSNPAEFYDHLRSDKPTFRNNIVAHSLNLFRRVRNLVHHADIPDEESVTAYLAILALLFGSGPSIGRAVSSLERRFQMPRGAKDVFQMLPQGGVDTLLSEYQSLQLGNRYLAADVSLAIRHASGAIFQEAHHALVQGPPPDLFDYVAPATSRRSGRGGVHFTPPFLARALSEQALQALGDLNHRKRIVIADIACGSAAFLIEALRALERLDYSGHVTLVGRDTSNVAINMARFVLGVAVQEWPGRERITLDLEVADSLTERMPVLADAVVMNPPFTQWQDLGADERELLLSIIGEKSVSRPDLSMAFVERALDILKPDGALATLLPASTLDAKSGVAWRGALLDRMQVFLSALFDDQTIFSHARVRVGALVLSGRPVRNSIRIHAGPDRENAGDALRALRLRNWNRDSNQGFSVFLTPTKGRTSVTKANHLASIPEWAIDLDRSRPLTALAQQSITTTVKDVFDVRQGIRTGENKAFVLDKNQWLRLPAKERFYFRPAISSKGISAGRVTQLFYVFYPYGPDFHLDSASELRQRVPRYYQDFLEPNREKLIQRRGKADRWWELSERRSGMEDHPPAFVSKYWAKPGGFVRHDPDHAVVLQGFGWVYLPNNASSLNAVIRRDIELCYFSLLNSKSFFNLISEHAPPTGGGQLDMSPRYIQDVPLVNLFRSHEDFPYEMNILSQHSRLFFEGRIQKTNAEDEVLEAAASALLGLKPRSTSIYGDSSRHWLRPFVESGHAGTDRAYRVKVLKKLQDLARAGDYSEIDAALFQAPVSQLAETSLMTLLRGSYRFKSRLAGWESFRERVALELDERGADVKRLLVGLYE